MGEQAGTGQAALDGAAGSAGLVDRVAAGAGEFGPNMARHMEVARCVFQHFRDVLADLAQSDAAGCAAASALRVVHHDVARQMLGQLALRGTGLGLAKAAAYFNVGDLGSGRLVGRRNWRQCGVHQLQLSFMIEFLAGAPVAHALEIAQFQIELVDGQVRRLQSAVALLDRFGQRVDLGQQHIRCHEARLCQS